MTLEAFEKIINDGIEDLPLRVRRLMNNVAILVDSRAKNGEALFGLYEGVPLTMRSDDFFDLPDRITIYMDTILDTYSKTDDIKECVSNTIWHEVAHHFGFEEEWIEAEEIKRGKTL